MYRNFYKNTTRRLQSEANTQTQAEMLCYNNEVCVALALYAINPTSTLVQDRPSQVHLKLSTARSQVDINPASDKNANASGATRHRLSGPSHRRSRLSL